MAASRPGRAFVGISGWRYAPWRGVFYPPGLAQRHELAFASRALPTIELNGSFYALQRPEDYAAWRDATPDGFVFAVKGPRFITHRLKLTDLGAPLANFFASGMARLGPKLGPLLWQFPPAQRWDPARFAPFLERLPKTGAEAAALAAGHDARVDGRADTAFAPGPMRHAVEIRHPSFATPAFVALLREHGVALVVADTAGRWPLLEDLTADFVYLRLHGDVELYASGYGAAALDFWARRIDAWRRGAPVPDARRAAPAAAPGRGARDVYAYFDNDIKVHAPYDAAGLAARLGVATGLGPDGRFTLPPELAPRRARRRP